MTIGGTGAAAMERQIGSRYELLEPLGKGAMGQVWRGRTREGEPVAVKVLRPELAEDPTLVNRFLQERVLLTRVDHPAVVRVRDLVAEGDRLALVMDLVEGGSLRQLLVTSAPLVPAVVAALAADVADGLAAIHAAGIVHRDVKPENVLVEAGGRHARVTDFGISGLVEGPTTRMTKLIGTPEYMAPEVVERVPATPAVDVYGLGIMLFEMLAGSTPFAGGHELAVLERHRSGSCPRLPWAPEPLAELLDRMLAKDPAGRPAAAEVAACLRELPLGDLGPQSLLDPADMAAQALPVAGGQAHAGGTAVQPATLVKELRRPAGASASSVRPGRRPPLALLAVGVVVAGLAAAVAVTAERRASRPGLVMTRADAAGVATTAPPGPTTVPPPPLTLSPGIPGSPVDAATEPAGPGGPTDPGGGGGAPVTVSGQQSGPAPLPTSVPAVPPVVVTTAAPPAPPAPPATPAPLPPPVSGTWTAPPSGLEGHCSPTQQVGPNLWWQICWSGPTPMLLATVTGITGQSPNPRLSVPRIWTMAGTVPSRGTSCPARVFTPGTKLACIDRTGPTPNQTTGSHGRLKHGDVESSVFTRRL